MVDEVTAPGLEGEFGVLAGHTPFFTALEVGEIMYRLENKPHYIAVTKGFVEVLPDKITILAEAAEFPHEIDKERAQSAKERAEQRLQRLSPEDKDFYRSVAALRRALNRLQVVDRR